MKAIVDRFLEGALAAILGGMVLVVSWQVLTRFLLRQPSSDHGRARPLWARLARSARRELRLRPTGPPRHRPPPARPEARPRRSRGGGGIRDSLFSSSGGGGSSTSRSRSDKARRRFRSSAATSMSCSPSQACSSSSTRSSTSARERASPPWIPFIHYYYWGLHRSTRARRADRRGDRSFGARHSAVHDGPRDREHHGHRPAHRHRTRSLHPSRDPVFHPVRTAHEPRRQRAATRRSGAGARRDAPGRTSLREHRRGNALWRHLRLGSRGRRRRRWLHDPAHARARLRHELQRRGQRELGDHEPHHPPEQHSHRLCARERRGLHRRPVRCGLSPRTSRGHSTHGGGGFHRQKARLSRRRPGRPGEIFRRFLAALPSLFLVVLVMGGIVGGTFTATEAGAIAVVYSFVLAVPVYREVTLRDVPKGSRRCRGYDIHRAAPRGNFDGFFLGARLRAHPTIRHGESFAPARRKPDSNASDRST